MGAECCRVLISMLPDISQGGLEVVQLSGFFDVMMTGDIGLVLI